MLHIQLATMFLQPTTMLQGFLDKLPPHGFPNIDNNDGLKLDVQVIRGSLKYGDDVNVGCDVMYN